MTRRTRHYAVTNAINSLSHIQNYTNVPKEDRRYQRFVRRDSKHDEVTDFEMRVQTFGAASSLCIAQFVKKENAKKYKTKYPDAAYEVINNTYVDDTIVPCQTE